MQSAATFFFASFPPAQIQRTSDFAFASPD